MKILRAISVCGRVDKRLGVISGCTEPTSPPRPVGSPLLLPEAEQLWALAPRAA